MDILTHTISGLAAGALAAGFSDRGIGSRVTIVVVSGLGGALPDIDAASYLLHDGTYEGHLWWSHHGFFHSLAAAFLFAIVIGCACRLFRARGKTIRLFAAGFFAGFVSHLLEDMPTPAASWGGVRLFFPSETYIGGTGQIWWWNNYDLFIVIFAVFVLCFGMLFVRGRWVRWMSCAVFALGCFLCAFQVYARQVDYAYTGHTAQYPELETASTDEQRRILGPQLFGAMERLDRAIPLNF